MKTRSFLAWPSLFLFAIFLLISAWFAPGPVSAAAAAADQVAISAPAALDALAGAATTTEPSPVSAAALGSVSAAAPAAEAYTAKALAVDLVTDVGKAALTKAATGGGINPYYLIAVALGTIGGWFRTYLKSKKKATQVADALASLKAGSRAGFAATDCLLDDRPGDPNDAAEAFADVVMVSRSALRKLEKEG